MTRAPPIRAHFEAEQVCREHGVQAPGHGHGLGHRHEVGHVVARGVAGHQPRHRLPEHGAADQSEVSMLGSTNRSPPGPGVHVDAVAVVGSVDPAEEELEVAGVTRWRLVLQKVASELHPKVRNHGEGPY